MTRDLVPALIVSALIASAAYAEIPAQVTPELAPQPLDAADFILTLPVERTGEPVEVLFIFREDGTQSAFDVLRVTGDTVEIHAAQGGTPKLVDHRGAELPGGRFGLTVHARGPHLVVSAGDEVLAHFLREEFGSAFVGAQATGAAIGDLMVQPLGDVTFDEDFFATEQVPDRWETLRGAWEVGIYWDPLQEMDNRPIGASWYEPGEGDCLAATGYDIFDSYHLAATTRIAQGRGGLAFHVRGPDDYCAFEVGEGAARLIEVTGGEREVLAEAPVELRPDWSYRLRADVSTGHARCFMNDEPLVETGLSPALTGRIGLMARDAAGMRFDDITARPFIATHIPEGASAEQAFVYEDGTWHVEDGALVGHVKGSEVAGLRGKYSDCEVNARVSATRDAVVGITAGHNPEGRKSALIFTLRAGEQPTWQLHRVDGGETTRLAGGPSVSASGLMTLRIAGGRLACLLDGQLLCETHIANRPIGRAGAYLQGGRASFSDFSCRELTDEPRAIICRADGNNTAMPALEEKVTIRPIGQLWRPRSGSWRCEPTENGPRIVARGDGGFNTPVLRFHEVTPGEPRLSVDTDGTAGVTLGICMGEEAGYEAAFSPEQGSLRLLRRGEVVFDSGAGGNVTWAPGEIRRDGDWVLIGARDASGAMRTVHAWRDPDPLPDGYAEISTSGDEVRFSSITLGSDSALAYKFDRVEPDWQPRSGTWSDHTGMACILWDYWMTGDGREEPAFTWNRHPMPEDVALDVSAAEFTEGHETGHHEHFPYHDVSVILRGTPGDPDSGYRFVVGADRGVRNVLLRNGVEVASGDDPRCRIVMGGHCNTPRAVRIRAQRAGNELTLTFNGIEVISWTDPEPLSGGGYVGLGSEGCRTLFRDCVVYPGVRNGS